MGQYGPVSPNVGRTRAKFCQTALVNMAPKCCFRPRTSLNQCCLQCLRALSRLMCEVATWDAQGDEADSGSVFEQALPEPANCYVPRLFPRL